uniref:Uncharacterized protein n=1 Tax=Tetraselmis sp. GSL018 TaxID=582737 RepID=A0A061SDF8_9CHLO
MQVSGSIISRRCGTAQAEPKRKDRLAGKKSSERENKALRKFKHETEKERKKEEKRKEAAAIKAVRHLNGKSKRFAKEQREEARRHRRRAKGEHRA